MIPGNGWCCSWKRASRSRVQLGLPYPAMPLERMVGAWAQISAHVIFSALVLSLGRRRRAQQLALQPVAPQKPTLPAAGFHRRTLPAPAIGMSSEEGRKLHKEAMSEGGMEIFFRLAEAFHTQAEPAYCGLGTLVTVLNALEIDPGTVLIGAWRWYSE